MTISSFYFSTGGTLPRDATSYVIRQADNDLFNYLLKNEFCYVLTIRQMGKSSLMIRTAERLHQAQRAVVRIDLTQIGKTNVSTLEFYDAIQIQIDDQLGLGGALDDFWQQSRFEPVQRFMRGLREVVLARCPQSVVIFVDEIDSVQSLPTALADEFFGLIRSCFTERAHDSQWQRLSFCLLGVATPSELIKNPLMTPFNIGQRIVLNDFTSDEVMLFAQGMNREISIAQTLLQRVMYWTNGQPYLTQLLCKKIAEDTTVTAISGVDRLCEELFFAHRARENETNLQHVRTLLLREGVDHAAVLDLYRQVRRRKRIKDSETNSLIHLLQLAGLVRVVDEYLWVRNRIYFRAFDEAWIETHLPDAEKRRQRAAQWRGFLQALGISSVVVAGMLGLTLWAWQAQREASRQEAIAIKQKNLALQAVNTLTYEQMDELLKKAPNARQAILEIFNSNIKTLEAIYALAPDDPKAQREKSVNLNNIGDTWLILGNTKEALQAYQQYFEIAKRLAAADPDSAEAQRDLSVSYERLGNVQLQLGNTKEALQAYQQSLEIRKRRAAADPDSAEAQRDLSVSYNNLGNVQLQLGNTKEALQAYQQSLEIAKRRAAADPDSAEAQRDLSVSYSNIAEIYLKDSMLEEALAWYQKSLAIDEKLAALDPLNQTFQDDLKIDKRKIADIQARLKKKKKK